MTGKEMSVAVRTWLASEEGKRVQAGEASGQYLRNRLEIAFLAGIEAAEALWKDVPTERLKTL